MDFGFAWRGAVGVAAVSVGAGVLTILGAPAIAAACPAVSAAGVVTPAPAPGVDWSGCNLRDANLSGGDLSGADLSGAFLADANLTSANLTSANLGSARLYNTTGRRLPYRPLRRA
jgi:hypothetical protein